MQIFTPAFRLPFSTAIRAKSRRTNSVITQMQEQQQAFTNGQVLTDVKDACEGLKSNDKLVLLYRDKYRDIAKRSRDIADYAYHRGGISLLDFLDAERSYRAAELGLSARRLLRICFALEQLRESASGTCHEVSLAALTRRNALEIRAASFIESFRKPTRGAESMKKAEILALIEGNRNHTSRFASTPRKTRVLPRRLSHRAAFQSWRSPMTVPGALHVI